MNNRDALIVSMVVGIAVMFLASYLLSKRQVFYSKRANVWAGAALGVVALSLFPVLSQNALETKDGEKISTYFFPVFSFFAFLFWVSMAFLIDKKQKNKDALKFRKDK